MAHEFFGLPSESHGILSLAVLNGALMFLVPVGLIAYLCWRDKRRARAGVAKPRRRRRRRARPGRQPGT